MPKYKVTIYRNATSEGTFFVDAEDDEDAWAAALDRHLEDDFHDVQFGPEEIEYGIAELATRVEEVPE